MDEHELFFMPAKSYDGHPAVAGIHKREIPNSTAAFAMAIIERFALIAGEEEGEDSAGRQKMRRMGPDEIAEFACNVAASTFDEFRERGWMIDIPSLAECEERAHENDRRNR